MISDFGLGNETSPQSRKERKELQFLRFAFLSVLCDFAVQKFEIRNPKSPILKGRAIV